MHKNFFTTSCGLCSRKKPFGNLKENGFKAQGGRSEDQGSSNKEPDSLCKIWVESSAFRGENFLEPLDRDERSEFFEFGVSCQDTGFIS